VEYFKFFQLTLIFNTFLGDVLQSTLYSTAYQISHLEEERKINSYDVETVGAVSEVDELWCDTD
jgi:hypothetical protein